ncbi:hypothetical protein BB558_004833 [Smittium angustum]|uniref:PCI domain-containing protein n=1 Tax=Smittium angustum TaxID=133377 RepID=A0A2U1J2C5_SMIAN|nr:hypothetical protein BB558_004833 [Smittium angustum]
MSKVSTSKPDLSIGPETKKDFPLKIDSTSFADDLERCIKFLNKGSELLETSYIARALKEINSLTKKADDNVILRVLSELYASAPADENLRDCLAESIKLCGRDIKTSTDDFKRTKVSTESIAFTLLLVLNRLLESKQLDKGVTLSTLIINKINQSQKRTLDLISAKIYQLFGRFYELSNQLSLCRPLLLRSLQAVMLTKSAESIAIIVNLLLGNYIHSKLYSQAEKLASRTSFPEHASNNQIARYLYYTGYINAIELNYSSSYQNLQDASRKITLNASTAGFQQHIQKLLVIVSLLIGEIPERLTFKNKYLKKSLQPYLELVVSVRTGELASFQHIIHKHSSTFQKDGLMALVLRLRHNVIKAGIKSICTSYKKISLRDICIKLHLDSEEDAEYIVSKAISDSVIDATINHEKGYVETVESSDAYSTSKPQEMFNQRISFCLNLYSDTIKAMRYPDALNSKDFDSAAEVRERERELAHEF